MKTYLIAFVALFLGISVVLGAERKELGWIERSSVGTILKQFGYHYTVQSGYKTAQDDPEDGAGWYITVRCQNKDKVDYNGTLWISDDWKKGRVISMKKRE